MGQPVDRVDPSRQGQMVGHRSDPFESLGGPPGPDAVWYFNFCRTAYRETPQFVIDGPSIEALTRMRVAPSALAMLLKLKDKPFKTSGAFEQALKAKMKKRDFARYRSKILAWAGPQRRSMWSPGRYPLIAWDCTPIAFGESTKEWIVPPPVEKAPVMDGTLDDPIWMKGLQLCGFVAAGTHSGGTPHQTTVSILRDGEALFLGFDCEQPDSPDVHTSAKDHDGNVADDESVEILIDRHDAGMIHHHFAFNAEGVRRDSLSAKAVENYRNRPHSHLYDLATGDRLATIGEEPAIDTDTIYTLGHPIAAGVVRKDGKKASVEKLWECAVDGRRALIKSGHRLYAGGDGVISAVDIPRAGGQPQVSWTSRIKGMPRSLLAADDRLFAVTIEGRIYCFGADAPTKPTVHQGTKAKPSPSGPQQERAEHITATTNIREGYCIVAGLTDGGLVEALARGTDLHVIAVDPDKSKVNALRQRLDAAGLYGRRVTVHVGDPQTYPFPPYVASLITTERPEIGKPLAERLFSLLRPFGGKLCLPAQGDAGRLAVRSRDGALPGTADWTHQDCDMANSLCSDDDLVRAPLGVLWFGGPPPSGMISRHGHGPRQLVIGGRIFITGLDLVRAVDAYTGRVLWETSFPGIGHRYNTDYHSAGVNRFGSTMAGAADALYVVKGRTCTRLDPATGEEQAVLKLPPVRKGGSPGRWAFVGVWQDLLIAGGAPTFDDAGSRCLAVLNRETGDVLWTRTATHSFLHNGIVAGKGRLYCLDKPSPGEAARQKRRGATSQAVPRVVALDIRTGNELWSADGEAVSGTGLALSEEHDVLVVSGRPGDGMRGETTDRLAALRAKDGSVLWKEKVAKYRSPPILHGRTIIAQPWAWDLLTGKPGMRRDPVTGVDTPWTFSRNYGCNTVIGSKHLLTFRSAAAGYFDLAADGGTGNFGGFKSGCTANLVAANGVLAAPDFTATCTCSYQNQTSLGLIHMPDNETWTIYHSGSPNAPVRRLGLNLGAPGDRLADDGTLWLRHPQADFKVQAIIGMHSRPVEAAVVGGGAFCRHSSALRGDGRRWVAASGRRDVETVVLVLRPGDIQLKPGRNVIAAQVHQRSGASSDLSFDAELTAIDAAGKTHVLIPFGAEWKYNDSGKDPGARWSSTDFDDRSWTSGKGKLGYGDGDEATVLSFGADPKKKHAAAFFRRAFDAKGLGNVATLRLRIRYDDGFAMYLDGAPLFAKNVRHGQKHDQLADGSHEGKTIETFEQAICGPGVYTVRLHFAEPDDLKPGDRVFDVFAQDKLVCKGLDIVKEAGGLRRTLVKEVRGVHVESKLTLRFRRESSSRHGPILCGVEAVLEE